MLETQEVWIKHPVLVRQFHGYFVWSRRSNSIQTIVDLETWITYLVSHIQRVQAIVHVCVCDKRTMWGSCYYYESVGQSVILSLYGLASRYHILLVFDHDYPRFRTTYGDLIERTTERTPSNDPL